MRVLVWCLLAVVCFSDTVSAVSERSKRSRQLDLFRKSRPRRSKKPRGGVTDTLKKTLSAAANTVNNAFDSMLGSSTSNSKNVRKQKRAIRADESGSQAESQNTNTDRSVEDVQEPENYILKSEQTPETRFYDPGEAQRAYGEMPVGTYRQLPSDEYTPPTTEDTSAASVPEQDIGLNVDPDVNMQDTADSDKAGSAGISESANQSSTDSKQGNPSNDEDAEPAVLSSDQSADTQDDSLNPTLSPKSLSKEI
eukprot:Blabericola_migrator_1__4996@NODE_2598_length_2554_cov_165_538802_g1629_i0_p2_GENE_NODE_2598_length_2554_cov_165_538802_g1629_i0NODE_2598_length_2554_cov_165_538802_g1629_i0_p2_ORF_typecomplete_len252_score35_43Glyco_hydro_67N/PF03648_14/0_052_NODE_2598_length_2554_cov_165_538802_g1629_i015592314